MTRAAELLKTLELPAQMGWIVITQMGSVDGPNFHGTGAVRVSPVHTWEGCPYIQERSDSRGHRVVIQIALACKDDHPLLQELGFCQTCETRAYGRSRGALEGL